MDFIRTGYGRKFFDADLPRLLTALERIATALEGAQLSSEELARVEDALRYQISKTETSQDDSAAERALARKVARLREGRRG